MNTIGQSYDELSRIFPSIGKIKYELLLPTTVNLPPSTEFRDMTIDELRDKYPTRRIGEKIQKRKVADIAIFKPKTCVATRENKN